MSRFNNFLRNAGLVIFGLFLFVGLPLMFLGAIGLFIFSAKALCIAWLAPDVIANDALALALYCK